MKGILANPTVFYLKRNGTDYFHIATRPPKPYLAFATKNEMDNFLKTNNLVVKQ